MEFIGSNLDRPFSSAVIHSGRVLETVLTGIKPGTTTPVEGGAAMELREIFRQLDEVLATAGVDKTSVCSARIYLQHVNRDVGEINKVWKEYFGTHPSAEPPLLRRRDLQSGMLVEAGFVAEMPD